MTDLNVTLDATTATPATLGQEMTAVEKLLFASRAIAGSIKKVEAADENTFNQRVAVQQLRDDVTAALAGDGDFDAASKAFKAGNNKLDRLIDNRDSMLSGAKAGVKAIRDLLDSVSDQLRDMED